MSSVRVIADRVAIAARWQDPLARRPTDQIDTAPDPYLRQFVSGSAQGPIRGGAVTPPMLRLLTALNLVSLLILFPLAWTAPLNAGGAVAFSSDCPEVSIPPPRQPLATRARSCWRRGWRCSRWLAPSSNEPPRWPAAPRESPASLAPRVGSSSASRHGGMWFLIAVYINARQGQSPSARVEDGLGPVAVHRLRADVARHRVATQAGWSSAGALG